MKIDKVEFHFDRMMAGQLGSTITMQDGTRIKAWFDPQTLALTHVNSLPRERAARGLKGFRRLDTAAGCKLAEQFKACAGAHFAAAHKAHEVAKAAAAADRLVTTAREQQERRDKVVAFINNSLGIDYKAASRIADALIEYGFIARNR